MSWVIYAIVIGDSRKVYIGLTSRPRGRFRHHLAWLKANKHHNPGLQKIYGCYSDSDVTFYILDRLLTKEAAVKREKFYIDAPELSEYILNVVKKGLKRSPKYCAAVSARAKLRTGEKNPFFGRKHSERTKKIISEAHLGIKPPNMRKIIADGVEYESLTDAARSMDVWVGTILNRVRSKNYNYFYKDC